MKVTYASGHKIFLLKDNYAAQNTTMHLKLGKNATWKNISGKRKNNKAVWLAFSILSLKMCPETAKNFKKNTCSILKI